MDAQPTGSPPALPHGAQWRIGENLPWVVPWSDEARFALHPSARFPGLLEIVQPDAPSGVPKLSGMNVMRQRQGVLDHRCQVCGRATDREDRFLFPTTTGALQKVKGRLRYLSHFPPVHSACADIARRLCPHLRGANAAPVPFPNDPGEVVPETSVPEAFRFLADQFPTDRPVVFAYFRLYGEGFSRVVQRLRSAG